MSPAVETTSYFWTSVDDDNTQGSLLKEIYTATGRCLEQMCHHRATATKNKWNALSEKHVCSTVEDQVKWLYHDRTFAKNDKRNEWYILDFHTNIDDPFKKMHHDRTIAEQYEINASLEPQSSSTIVSVLEGTLDHWWVIEHHNKYELLEI